MIDTVIIVSGWRGRREIAAIEYRLSLYSFTANSRAMLIHGGCQKGADKIAHRYARRMGWPISIFPMNPKDPDSAKSRHREMIQMAILYAAHGVEIIVEAFPHEEDSVGTWDLVNRAKRERFKLFINSKEHTYQQETLFA